MSRELKQETLAEIEEELRSGEYAPLADRIHAAWERERDELIYSYDPTKAEKSRAPDGSAYALEALEYPACTPIGNAAAMYAALKEMQARLVAGVQDGMMDCYEALEIVEKALAEPPRNCERFNTKEDAAMAFNEEKNTFIPQSLLWQLGEWLDWLFAPAKKGAAK